MLSRRFAAIAVGLLVGIATLNPVAIAQAPELRIRADKGGYIAGEAATVSVTGLTECAGQTITLGMRDVGRGARFATKDVQLDASGSGSAKVALMSDNGGSPLAAAAWGNCVDRGFEPGLALDPQITLLSVSYATQPELIAFVPAGARAIAETIAAGDLEGLVRALSAGEVIKTGYPGDGGPIAREVVASELRSRLAPGSGSDEFGTGRLGLMGAWEINGGYALLASVIRNGQREVQALGVAAVNGSWVITSSGAVVMQTGILQTYAEQHRLRLGNIGPLPPSVGNSEALDQDTAAVTWFVIAATLLTLTLTLFASQRHRSDHRGS